MLLAACVPHAQAVPAAPNATTELKQPSGETFSANLFGDEWYGGYETPAGYTILRDGRTKYWRYAVETEAGGQLRPAGPRVGVGAPENIDRHLRASVHASEVQPATEELDSPNPPNTGTQRSLVILAQFADQASRGTTAAQWAGRFFGTSNSVDDYYDEVSGGQLRFAPAAETSGTQNDGVVGWVTLNYDHPIRDWTKSSSDYDASRRIVRDAIVAANGYVDYSDYDTRAPFGTITADELHVTVIPAGNEAATGCSGAGEVWGHKSSTWIYTPTVDGVEVGGGNGGSYTIFGEVQCTGGDHMATIGVIVHELGHDLDMPDLYDTDGSSTGGVGPWSVMASGTWNTVSGQYGGVYPAHPDAFLKYYQGWTSPTVVSGSQRLSLGAAESSRDAVRLGLNPAGVDWTFGSQSGSGEYFLVENRQRTGYDVGLPACGMLIYHVDETRSSSDPNQDDSRRLVDLEEADGEEALPRNGGSPASDPYLAGSFDDNSTPGSRYYSGSTSGVAATSFSNTCASTMAADFRYGSAPPNDDFADARPLTGATANRDNDTNLGATKEDAAGEPDHADNEGGASIWYRWTAPASGTVTIDTLGSDFDTTLAAYTGTSLNGLSEVASDDDIVDGEQRQSRISFPATAGATYQIAVDGYNNGEGPETGTVDLHLSSTVPDTDPPETTITAGPSGTTDDPSPSFSFSSDEANSSFQCRLDGAAFTACSSPHAYSSLADGPHTFEVRATDQAANTDPTPASRSFTVDTTVPDTTVDGSAYAKRKQEQPRRKITVEATVCATGAEILAVEASGRVRVGGASYGLRPVQAMVSPDRCRALRLTAKQRQARAIHKALNRGKRVNAKLTLELGDWLGNSEIEKLTVRLGS
ncbi:MAG: M6 family metalloprotease domain-containing protein [Thermomicrobiales bacterium]|nr:M6 family metalloprotease domain-containing protein [Thermomicrobiales bacterium]